MIAREQSAKKVGWGGCLTALTPPGYGPVKMPESYFGGKCAAYGPI